MSSAAPRLRDDVFTSEAAATAYVDLGMPLVAHTTTGNQQEQTGWITCAIMEVKDTPMTATSHAADIETWLRREWDTEPTPELVAWLDEHPVVWAGLHDAPSAIREVAERPVRLRLALDNVYDGVIVLVGGNYQVGELVDLVDEIDIRWTIHLPDAYGEQVRVDCDFTRTG